MSVSSRGLRFPAAIQIFPSLRDFIHVRPRRLAAVPIGHPTNNVRNDDLPACLRHVYHDLGVLVFAGMNNAQISTAGDIIRRLVSSGGIGTVLTAVDWRAKAKRKMIPPPKKEDYFEAVDWAHSGILKPKSLLNIAETYLPDEVTSTVLMRDPFIDPSKLQLRERAIILKGKPIPKGVLHSTVDGPRILPLECFTSVRIDDRFSNLYGEIILFSGGGKGQFAGSVRVEYTLLHVDEDKSQMRAWWMPRKEDDLDDDLWSNESMSGTIVSMLEDNVLRPLWKLEREVYADKADRLVNYDDFKTGLKGWSSKPRRNQRRADVV